MGKAAKRTARERLAEQRRIEARRKKRNKRLGIVAAAVVVVIVVVGGIVGFQAYRASTGPFTGTLAPITRQPNGTVVMAKPGVTAPVLDIWEDFQCPICHQFEKTNDDNVKRIAAEGKAKVVYHPMTIFQVDPKVPESRFPHDNSVRALNASMAVPTDKWIAFHDKLYANQPEETQQGGFPASQLIRLGKQVGVTTPAFVAAVNGMTYQKQAEANTQRALTTDKIEGTPTLRLNGKDVDTQSILSDASALPAAVDKAAKAAQ